MVCHLLATAAATAAVGAGIATPAAARPDTTVLFNAAQHHFAAGDDAAGRAELRTLLDRTPRDVEALELQALWSHYAGDLPASIDALGRLRGIDPARAAQADRLIAAVDAAATTLPNPLPTLAGPNTGIVVLGYGLLPGGVLRPELVNRLTAAWLQAIAAPLSPIVLTGGNPVDGVAEADAMGAWLIGHGVPASRVRIENRASSTVQNALLGTQILRSVGATNAIVVTSPNHIRRAVADFLVAGTQVVGATTSLEQLVSQLPPPSKSAQRGIYLDATRTALIPGTR